MSNEPSVFPATSYMCMEIDQRVIRTLSPHELMNRDDKNFPEEYWIAGRSALGSVRAALNTVPGQRVNLRRILDLPCGYGRVLRYLQAAFPNAELTACDLDRDAVDFCACTFGAIPIYSQEDLSEIPLERDAYDLIWVGSLFTHIDVSGWKKLLSKLAFSLRDSGLLVFTTHGRYSYRQLMGIEDFNDYSLPYWRITRIVYGYEKSGFGYADYEGAQNYGISLSEPQWVLSMIDKENSLRCVYFSECSWHGVQDTYACVKSSHPSTTQYGTTFSRYMKHLVREVWRP